MISASNLIILFTQAVHLVASLSEMVKNVGNVLTSEEAEKVEAELRKLRAANDVLYDNLQSRLRG